MPERKYIWYTYKICCAEAVKKPLKGGVYKYYVEKKGGI